jgi:hypothetical protein
MEFEGLSESSQNPILIQIINVVVVVYHPVQQHTANARCHKNYTGRFKIIVRVSMAYNFQTRNNKIKLVTEYGSVTQKVLIPLESILQNAKQLQHAHL